VNRSAAPVEKEKKKRRLRRLSCLDQDAGPSALFLGDGLVDAILEVNAEGCDDAQSAGGVFDKDEEEEKEILLIRKNNRHYRGIDGGSDIPSQAMSAFVSLQGLSISDFDQALEEVILEDILSEPPEADIPTICSEVPEFSSGGPYFWELPVGLRTIIFPYCPGGNTYASHFSG
jgi:hypothetical protein